MVHFKYEMVFFSSRAFLVNKIQMVICSLSDIHLYFFQTVATECQNNGMQNEKGKTFLTGSFENRSHRKQSNRDRL